MTKGASQQNRYRDRALGCHPRRDALLLAAHNVLLPVARHFTDTPETRNEHGMRVVRAMTVRSRELGLFGVCDIVEFRDGVPTPVEYKRGKPKPHRADEVQLCAQALCLEELMDCRIEEADLFYGKTRRRR